MLQVEVKVVGEEIEITVVAFKSVVVAAGGLIADAIEAGGIGHWKRALEDTVYQGEDRCRGADAERQRDDRGEREAGRFTELTKAVADILHDRLHPHGPAALAAVFLDLVDAAELEPGEPAASIFGNAGANFVRDLRLDVEAQFLIQLDVPFGCGRTVSAASS